MGLNSWRESMTSCSRSEVMPISLAISWMSASLVGRNSCRGGSRKRMTTGWPSMASYRPSKSPC